MYDPAKEYGLDSFAFPFQCVWLKLNGSWPVEAIRSTFVSFYNFWSIFVIILVGVTIYFQTMFLVHTLGDILMVTENCCTTFMGMHNFLRLVHMRWNRNSFQELLSDFVRNIWIRTGSDEVVEKRCRNEMVIFKVMSAMLFALICMYCILPLFELFADLNATVKPFPYKMIFPYNAHEGVPYVTTYILTSLAGCAVVTTLFAEDTLFGFFVVNTCGQFKILHKKIDNIVLDGQLAAMGRSQDPHVLETVLDGQLAAMGRSKDPHVPETVVQKQYSNVLNGIVRKHNNLIEFCNKLESFVSPILLVNFAISAILICMVGFQIVTVKMSLGNLAKFVLYISSSMGQLFILCLMGDNLINNVGHLDTQDVLKLGVKRVSNEWPAYTSFSKNKKKILSFSKKKKKIPC